MKFKNIFIRLIAAVMFFIVIGMEVMEYIEKGRLSSVPKAIMLLISLAVLFVSTFISKIDSAEKENLKAALERENIYFDSDKRAKKLFYRGIRGYYSGNFSVAYYYLQKAAEKAKGPEAAARAYCYIGRSAIAEKKYTRAVQSLKKSTELDRGYSIAWNNLAGAYHLINEKEKFRQACETGLLYCPADASLNSKLGRYYFDITEYEKAFDCFKKAERIDASNAVFTMNTALTYAALGDRENAEINFNKAKKKGYTDCDNAYRYIAELLAESRAISDNASDGFLLRTNSESIVGCTPEDLNRCFDRMLCDKNEFIVITSPAIFDDAEFVQAALIGEAVEIQVSAYNDGESKHYSKYYSKDTAREILLKLVEKNAVPDISDYMQGQF